MEVYITIFYILGFIAEFIILVNIVPILKKRKSAKYLLFFLLTITFWQLTLFFYYKSHDLEILTIIGRLNFLFSSLMVYSLQLFAFSFPFGFNRKTKPIAIILTTETLIISIITILTPLISQKEFISNGERITQFGPLFVFFVLHFLAYMFSILLTFIIKVRTTEEPFKTQIKYFLLGTGISGILGVLTNILLPWIFNFFYLQQLAPLFVIFICGIITYTFVRHRLFDSKLILGKFIHILFLSLFCFGFFYLINFIHNFLWGGIYNANALFVGSIFSIIFVYIFTKLNTLIAKFLDLNLIYRDYNPGQIIRKITEATSKSLNIDEISENITTIVKESMNLDQFGLLLFKDGNILYKGDYSSEIPSKIESLLQSQNLDTLFINDLINKSITIKNPIETINILNLYKLQVIKSNTLENNLKIILLVGSKKNKKPFTDMDLETLDTIEKNVSIIFSRAILHLEVQQFNKTLQHKVDRATTNLKNKNKDLQKLYNELETLYKREKDIMDIAGHELRTPASIIKTNLHMLKKRLSVLSGDEAEDPKIRVYLDRLIDGTERQITLVNTFLESARIDNQKFELNIETHNFTEILNDAVIDLMHSAEEKGIKIIYEKPSSKIFVDCDATRIREVLDNLLGNAVKYTKEGYIRVWLQEDSKNISVFIQDSGIGIKDTDRPHLFKKFSRLESYIGGKNGQLVRPGGTGLGLFIVKNIVNMHNGQITVDSEFDKGSTFSFSIPKKQPQLGFQTPQNR